MEETPRRELHLGGPVRVLMAMLMALLSGCGGTAGDLMRAAPAADRPNIVLIFADDLGYGDLSSYGHPTIRTPHLDRMAREGIRFTSFYAPAPVCTPSRAGLLTGRYPIRSGMTRVLFPSAETGLPESEVTVARVLAQSGYRTAAIGKWHLGHLPQYLPTAHGFDSYFGIPYSNDMDNQDRGDPLYIPLLRDTTVIEPSTDQATLTLRYTEEAERIMRESVTAGRPFFIYLAHTMPHLPLFASERFVGTSRAGLYGDVIEELDWSTGRILEVIEELDIDRNTIVIFTSDNGPWLTFGERYRRDYDSQPWHGGSAGPLRGFKSSTYEGGVRVPAIARWPGVIPAGQETAEIATAMDLYPTLIRLAGAQVPADRPVDGRDIMPVLDGGGVSPTQEFFYFREMDLEAVREGRWKLRISRHLMPEVGAGEEPPPELFDLEVDPGERFDVAADNPQVVERLRLRMRDFAREVGATLVGP